MPKRNDSTTGQFDLFSEQTDAPSSQTERVAEQMEPAPPQNEDGGSQSPAGAPEAILATNASDTASNVVSEDGPNVPSTEAEIIEPDGVEAEISGELPSDEESDGDADQPVLVVPGAKIRRAKKPTQFALPEGLVEALFDGYGYATPFDATMPLEGARSALLDLMSVGHKCPCCTQHAQIYRWSLYGRAAAALILLYRRGGTTEFIHSREVKPAGEGGSPHHALPWWGLAEPQPGRRGDGGKSGYWRVTELGARFVMGQATIPKYVYIFKARVLARDGELVTIQSALGKKFDYTQMMTGTL